MEAPRCGCKNWVKSVSHPSEPADYTGSYTRLKKRIVDTEIAMPQGSRTIVTTAVQMLSLIKLTLSEGQQEEGALKN